MGLSLSGCYGTDVERAGAGALVGGLGAAAIDGDVASGVLVGAAAGALLDDVTGY
jgi:F0F1-type ATP synthase assembly protein I